MTPEIPYVVLADDDPDDREFFCAAMKRVYPDVKAHTFNDGDELLKYLDSCSATSLPGFIVLDYKMPRLSGPQFLCATGPGTRYASIPKIVWSTSQLKKDRDDCLCSGALSFHTKPVSDEQLDDLLRSLEKWIHASVEANPSASRVDSPSGRGY